MFKNIVYNYIINFGFFIFIQAFSKNSDVIFSKIFVKVRFQVIYWIYFLAHKFFYYKY